MFKRKNLLIEYSITIENYQNKNIIDYSKQIFKYSKSNTDTIIENLKNGFSIMAVLKDYKSNKRKKSDISFLNYLAFDIDDCPIAFNNFINDVEIKPSLAYTTFNHQLKGNRFRLIYILNFKIRSDKELKRIYNYIKTAIEKSTQIKIIDNCCNQLQRIINGNCKENIEIYKSYLVYEKDDFKNAKPIEEDKQKKNVNSNSNDGNIKHDLKANFNEKYINDFLSLSKTEYLKKYKHTFEVIEHSKIEYNDNGYCLLNDDFIEIKRLYQNKQIKKLKDGQKRRKTLFIYGLIKKQIKPEISLDEMLYNIVFECIKAFDNTDNQLNKRILIEIANNAYNADYQIHQINKKKFKVNKGYCEKHGITPNQLKQIVKKQINDNLIKKYYNCNLSVIDNLNILHNNNIKCSKSKLYQFIKYLKNIA